MNSFVDHGQIDLSLERYAAQRQFVAKALFIGRFQQPGTKFPVDFDCGTDDFAGNPVFSRRLGGSFLFSLPSIRAAGQHETG